MNPDAGMHPIAPRTMADEAAERLRAAISSGALPAGAQLVERELAMRLGMSRVPVREAIQRLTEEGLVRRSVNRGAFVHAPTREEVEGIVSLRVLLEGFVAERAAERWTAAVERELDAVVERMRRAAAAGDRAGLSQLDQAFHDALWAAADHPVLTETAAGLRKRIARLIEHSLALARDDEVGAPVQSHVRLLEALRTRQPAEAAAAMKLHIESGLPWLTRALGHGAGGKVSGE